jgi:hypothetical protein
MSDKKKNGRSARSGRTAKRAASGAEGQSASLSAYQALLNADTWLMVASNVFKSIGAGSEGDKLEELRRSIAARLEYLQPAAYTALDAGER